jgi:hypothetical protein
MNSLKYVFIVFLISVTALFTACGGGGGGGDALANNGGGIGGTGITASGTVDGFGSIFVNGVEFETDAASIVLDGNDANESDLRLGMVVTVTGTVSDDGITGTADIVEFDDDVQGPITAIAIDLDGTSKTLTVLGFSIVVDEVSTTFGGVTFATLAINDVVEVSGFSDTLSVIHATRLEKKEVFVAGTSEIEIKGLVSGLLGSQFNLGSFTVDFSAADLSDVPGGNLVNGMNVEVKGTLVGIIITASQIEEEGSLFDEEEGDVSVEGLINSFVSVGNFQINGQQVDASNAGLEPATLQLMDDLRVEVEGNIVNGILIAEEVSARSGEIKLAATVQSLDVTNGIGSVTLAFATGSVSFSIDSQTELGDETDTFDPIAWSDIRAGDYLTVKALLNNNQIVATEVRLKTLDDELVQGPVESFVIGTEVVVFGLTYLTAGASFEDENDVPINSVLFYAQLTQGRLVKIQDDSPADGAANEVEFED